MTYPNLSTLDMDKIKVTLRTEDSRYMFYYGNERLFVRTCIMQCPYGTDGNGILYCEIPSTLLEPLEALDELVSGILDEQEETRDTYVPLVRTVEGRKVLKLHLNETVRVFDGNGNRVDNPVSLLANHFSSYFLLDLSTLSPYKDKYIWPSYPSQLRLKGYCTLPPGCVEYKTLSELSAALGAKGSTVTEQYAPVTDFDPDINELL